METMNAKLQKIEDQKQQKSHSYFKDTKISSCSYVQILNNNAQAVPFYKRPNQTYSDKMAPSSQVKSMASEFHSVKPDMHLGMDKKPLVGYEPNCKRNLLPVEELKLPANNASQIIIGDRTQKYNRHYLSTSQNTYGNFGKVNPVTNPGINASNTRWLHTRQNK